MQRSKTHAKKATLHTKNAVKKTHKKHAISITTAAKRSIMTTAKSAVSTPLSAASPNAVIPTLAKPLQQKTIFSTQTRLFSAMPPSGLLLQLPALSPTMEVGGLAKWHVKPGQLIKPGDLIADIETDKAVVGFESQDEYYLAAILMDAGMKDLAVGTPLGITVEDEADIAAAQAYAKVLMSNGASPAATPTTAAPKQEAPPAAPVAAPAPAKKTKAALPPKPASAAKMELPALSPTMEQGKLTKWHVQEGQLIKPGDLIADIETDKAVVGFESQDEYYLAKILVPEGSSNIQVNQLIAVTAEDQGDVPASQQWAEALLSSESNADVEEVVPDAASTAATTTATRQSSSPSGKYTHKHFLPAVDILLHETKVDPTSVKPTGPLGHLLKGDIINAIAEGTATYLSPASTTTKAPAAATPKAEQKAPVKAPVGAPTGPEMSGRRRRARQFIDMPVTPATTQAGKDLVANKVPQHYSSVTVSVNKLHSFVTTFAKDCDLNAALVSLIAKSINNNVKTVGKDIVIENDMFIINKATGTKSLLSRHVATQMGQVFTHSNANREIAQDNALFNIQLYTNLPAGTISSYERLLPGSLMNVVIGAPFVTVGVADPQSGQFEAEKNITISITTDNNTINETVTADILKSVKQFAAEPITMLL